MASLEWTQLWWNWKLNSSADLLYYDKINVDVVHPPYAYRDRNSSYFLKTRRWYQIDEQLVKYLWEDYKTLFNVVDVEILWEDICEKKNWIIYYMCLSQENDLKVVLSRPIVDWKIENSINVVWWDVVWTVWNKDIRWYHQYCSCTDEKFFKTSYVKWERKVLFNRWDSKRDYTWIQINRVEWWAMRWFFTDEAIVNWETYNISEPGEDPVYVPIAFAWWAYDWEWTPIYAWDYLVITASDNWDDDWFCWQIRTITWYNESTWELTLDSAWSWFKDWEDEVKWWHVSYMIFSDWWEVVWFTSWKWVTIALDRTDAVTMCDFWAPTNNASCIIASAASTDRMFFLYDNWWIHFWWVWRDKFFDSGDAMFCWEDKYNIECYRDFVLAMGSKNMAVAVADSTGQYYRMYNQSSTIWLKNKYAYWEYNWDFLICSNDNRLLALKIASNVWQYMLEYEDIWQYINPYLHAMLPWDKCYIAVDDNRLRVFINTLSDVDRDDFNTRTLILKYDTIFWVWTCDKLWRTILRWCNEWFFFWDWLYRRIWERDMVVYEEDDWPRFEEFTYNIWISAFLLENEENWQTQNQRSADLFSLAQLQKLIVLLWTWRYDDSNTQLKIIEYRNGYWYEQIISSLTTNDWVNNIGAAYEWGSVELSECVLSDIKDGSNAIRTTCKDWHKIQWAIPERELIWNDVVSGRPIDAIYSEHDYQLTDHRVCINDEVYKMAPHMPLVVELWDQENYNSQIYIELVSNSDDVINFGWFMANLSLAPLWHKWADWEYLIEVDTGC